MIDIIVPTFNQEAYTVRCFQNIRQCTSDYRLIWVDNGSTSESRRYVANEIVHHKNCHTIWSKENLGFVKAVNLGLNLVFNSDSEYVVLLNNDTEVTANWLDLLLHPLRTEKNIAMSGPTTDTIGSWQGWLNVRNKMFPNMSDLSNCSKDSKARKLLQTFKHQYRDVGMLAFFCTVFKVSAMKKIGFLDEVFGVGFGDDDDYSLRMKKTGQRIVYVPSCFVHHNHRTTFRANYDEKEIKKMQDENLNIFREKHRR